MIRLFCTSKLVMLPCKTTQITDGWQGGDCSVIRMDEE